MSISLGRVLIRKGSETDGWVALQSHEYNLLFNVGSVEESKKLYPEIFENGYRPRYFDLKIELGDYMKDSFVLYAIYHARTATFKLGGSRYGFGDAMKDEEHLLTFINNFYTEDGNSHVSFTKEDLKESFERLKELGLFRTEIKKIGGKNVKVYHPKRFFI